MFLSIRVIAVAMVLTLGTSAYAQRNVAPIQIEMGEWMFTPIAFGNIVESIVAFRDPATIVGDNIGCVWFKAEAAGEWSAHAWRNQDRSNAAAYVMHTLGIDPAQNTRWGEGIDPSQVSQPTAPEEIRYGVFLDDPLADDLEDMPDRQEFLEMLVEIGWEATRIEDDIPPTEDCEEDFGKFFLSAVAEGVEFELVNPTAGSSPSQGEEMAVTSMQSTLGCIVFCIRWTWKGDPTLVGCTCSPWTFPGPGWGPVWVGGSQCSATCWYSADATCTYTRSVTRRYWDCTRCTWTQTGTVTGSIKKSRREYFPSCTLPPGYTCAGGAPDDTSCEEPLGASPGDWTPEDCPTTPQ